MLCVSYTLSLIVRTDQSTSKPAIDYREVSLRRLREDLRFVRSNKSRSSN
jgi:hypothetical protein